MKKRVGLITIGCRENRPNWADLIARLEPEVEVDFTGVLDGLTREEVEEQFAFAPGENYLVTEVPWASSVQLSEAAAQKAMLRRAQEHFAAVMGSDHFVRDRVVAELNCRQILVSAFRTLADSIRNFLRLAVADADIALSVTGNDQSSEAEATTALDDLGAAIDVDHLIDVFGSFRFLARSTTVIAATALASVPASAGSLLNGSYGFRYRRFDRSGCVFRS